MQRIKDWVRREIVDTDPWDDGMVYPYFIPLDDLIAALPVTLEHPDASENKV